MGIVLDSNEIKPKEFWKDVSELIRILSKYNYDVLVRYDDCGVYIIEYCVNPKMEFGNERFEKISEEEYEKLINNRFAA